jgi:hypothetical protein
MAGSFVCYGHPPSLSLVLPECRQSCLEVSSYYMIIYMSVSVRPRCSVDMRCLPIKSCQSTGAINHYTCGLGTAESLPASAWLLSDSSCGRCSTQVMAQSSTTKSRILRHVTWFSPDRGEEKLGHKHTRTRIYSHICLYALHTHKPLSCPLLSVVLSCPCLFVPSPTAKSSKRVC